MTFLPSDGGADAFAFESLVEAILASYARSFPVETGDGVVGYEVYVGA